MKKIILLGFLILSILSCKAQIIPVEQVLNNFDNIEEGQTTYIKDVNNLFDNYIGTWTGISDNKNFKFIITKKTIVFDEEYNINQDVLLMRHLIVDSNNSEVIENTLLTSDDNVPCQGMLLRTNPTLNLTYEFDYGGEDYSSGQNGDVFITLHNNNTQLYLLLYPYNTIYPECQTGPAEQVLPIERILLTKQ